MLVSFFATTLIYLIFTGNDIGGGGDGGILTLNSINLYYNSTELKNMETSPNKIGLNINSLKFSGTSRVNGTL